MKTNLFDRSWISTVVAVAFGVIGVTGVLLFFHVKSGAIVSLHEWFGWVFVAVGAVHLALNWRPMLSYLLRRNALISLALSCVLLVGLGFMGPDEREGHGERGHGERGRFPQPVLLTALDANGDGAVDATELAQAGNALLKLDRDGDGTLTAEELEPRRAGGPGRH